MPLCLGIGELMVELAPSDSPDHLRRGFAGDVFNTLYYARMLMPADWQIGFHTAFGTDTLSDDMMDFIAQLQAHLVSHQYAGILDKANLKGMGRSGVPR